MRRASVAWLCGAMGAADFPLRLVGAAAGELVAVAMGELVAAAMGGVAILMAVVMSPAKTRSMGVAAMMVVADAAPAVGACEPSHVCRGDAVTMVGLGRRGHRKRRDEKES